MLWKRLILLGLAAIAPACAHVFVPLTENAANTQSTDPAMGTVQLEPIIDVTHFAGHTHPRRSLIDTPSCTKVCVTAFSIGQVITGADCSQFIGALNFEFFRSFGFLFIEETCTPGQVTACSTQASSTNIAAYIDSWNVRSAASLATYARLQTCQAPNSATTDSLLITGIGSNCGVGSFLWSPPICTTPTPPPPPVTTSPPPPIPAGNGVEICIVVDVVSYRLSIPECVLASSAINAVSLSKGLVSCVSCAIPRHATRHMLHAHGSCTRSCTWALSHSDAEHITHTYKHFYHQCALDI